MSTGRNFDEVLRLLDSCQLTTKHTVATPANWQPGQDVIIPPAVSDDEAEIPRRLVHGETLPPRRCAFGAEWLSIQKIRQLRMQKTATRLVRRCAVLSFDSSALQPDLRTLWNTSIF